MLRSLLTRSIHRITPQTPPTLPSRLLPRPFTTLLSSTRAFPSASRFSHPARRFSLWSKPGSTSSSASSVPPKPPAKVMKESGAVGFLLVPGRVGTWLFGHIAPGTSYGRVLREYGVGMLVLSMIVFVGVVRELLEDDGAKFKYLMFGKPLPELLVDTVPAEEDSVPRSVLGYRARRVNVTQRFGQGMSGEIAKHLEDHELVSVVHSILRANQLEKDREFYYELLTVYLSRRQDYDRITRTESPALDMPLILHSMAEVFRELDAEDEEAVHKVWEAMLAKPAKETTAVDVGKLLWVYQATHDPRFLRRVQEFAYAKDPPKEGEAKDGEEVVPPLVRATSRLLIGMHAREAMSQSAPSEEALQHMLQEVSRLLEANEKAKNKGEKKKKKNDDQNDNQNKQA